MDKIKSLLITLLAVAVVIIGIVSGDFSLQNTSLRAGKRLKLR
ncbi:hypothetical protein PO124_25595 [Bacillus licheniformis]|nr:hypothetical protein [Bacillus licheniformis]